jgi:hypothetical protein
VEEVSVIRVHFVDGRTVDFTSAQDWLVEAGGMVTLLKGPGEKHGSIVSLSCRDVARVELVEDRAALKEPPVYQPCVPAFDGVPPQE